MQIITIHDKVIDYCSEGYLLVGTTIVCESKNCTFSSGTITDITANIPEDFERFVYYYIDGGFVRGEEKVIEDYNNIQNQPIINKDLSQFLYTQGEANQIYRHTGETVGSLVKNSLYTRGTSSWQAFSSQGPQGADGDSAWIRYSASADGTNFTSTWTAGQNYIGVAVATTAPTTKTGYTWSLFVGPAGADGQPGAEGPAGPTGPQGPQGPSGEINATLNGTGTASPSWYAPTTAGTAGYELHSSGGVPAWVRPSGYVLCSTAAGTAAKTVSFSDFVLTTGVKVTVKFTYKNTASSVTLAVGGTAAKTVYYNGSAVSSTNSWEASEFVTFAYNGSGWYSIASSRMLVKSVNNSYSPTAIYAPTTAPATSTSKRYLVGSSSTTSLATVNTNSGCYMENNYLYSNSQKIDMSTVPGLPTGWTITSSGSDLAFAYDGTIKLIIGTDGTLDVRS